MSYFDPDKDRVALTMFATSTIVMDPINTSGRGFNKSSLLNHISGASTGVVSTATAEGLYAGWDQLRSVPSGSQAPLRVIVLFTDGAPNTFSGQFLVKPFHNSGTANVQATGALFTSDYPAVGGQGQPDPAVTGVCPIYGASFGYVSPTSAAGNALSPITTMVPSSPESSAISMPAIEPVNVERPQASA